ncbi:MAG: toll/interleukin-1 receptor domain-containing protein, partial [Eubacterium sp.]|nr:toll/interleukin-1 receptor domain-containing protein [Eubacterium sp.]
MAVFKCKICGGELNVSEGVTVCECAYCGTKQTLPKLDDEKKVNLYDRANHFRRNNEYDKAMSIYENILNEDKSDAEAYWSLVLCKYGIEYVEDPSSHKRIPTVNRTQFTSIFSDEDYKQAIQYADGYQKDIYESEAKAIDEIQKGILEISNKEEPFDVFICYKETDNQGRRTPDSVLATELYHELTKEGFKVFFSRITLEDKLGIAYEPYIFAALNSSKVMVALGTKAEYFNSVWVKNEWSRYLSLIKNGAKKTLIPAYRDMDPYDLPEEFSHLQAQDMSKLGFMQDLIRGISKILSVEKPKSTETVVINSGNASVEPLLKRAFMFLEDRDWNSADEYCEKVLDQDPENAMAYLGKLMAELKVTKQEKLADCKEPFTISNNYKKAVRFADNKLAEILTGYISHINERNENARLESIYNSAVAEMNNAKTQLGFEKAAKGFEAILEYKDSAVLVEKCLENAEIARKDKIYDTAKGYMTGDSIYS